MKLVVGTLLLFTNWAWATGMEMQICHKYRFLGKLSSDLKVTPTLSTWSENGLVLELVLSLPGETGLKAVLLKGKTVSAEILLTKRTGSRQYSGEAKDLAIHSPVSLKADSADFNAKDLGVDQNCKN